MRPLVKDAAAPLASDGSWECSLVEERSMSTTCAGRISATFLHVCRSVISPFGWAIAVMAWSILVPAVARAEQAGATNQTLLNLRVGIHVYASDGALKGEELERYRSLFREVAAYARLNYGRPVYIQAAAGSYADIYDWCKHDMIDLAVVTAGVYSMLKENTGDQWTYLCTMGQGDTRDRFEYGINCVVHQDSKLAKLDDVLGQFKAGNLDIYLVSELSTSGGVFPRAYLKEKGLELQREDIVFTGSHSNCLEELVRPPEQVAFVERTNSQTVQQQALEPIPAREKIAFVWDGAFQEGRDEKNLPIRPLPLEGLDSIRIPESAMIVRTAIYEENPFFFNSIVERDDFEPLADFERKYQRIYQWRSEFEEQQPADEEASGWTKLFDHFVRYKTETGEAPRIALVLAGGGAKCAYQVGVAQVLEQKFREFREAKALEPPECEISLVVGTSGGAINALPVAMGTYNSPTGVETIKTVWSGLDARDILLPEMAVRVGVGVTISFASSLLVLLGIRLRWRGKRLFPHERRARVAVFAFLTIGGVLLAWWLVSRMTGWRLPWGVLLGNSYNLYALWAIVGSSIWLVGFLLLVAGGVIWCIDRKNRQAGGYLALSAAKAREVIAWLTLISILLGSPIVLMAASHFSEARGLERTIARAARELINERLASRGQPKVDIVDLHGLSETILAPDHNLLEKDLIITATVLPEPDQQFGESDIYLFAEANRHGRGSIEFEKNFDNRFIDLEQGHRRKLLIDAVLGSGAVFPFFPPRTLKDCPRHGVSLHLVDGSFGHHIPIEAAVRWGATHILIVDPSPAEKELCFRNDRSLFENSQVALGHLFEQAQKVDRQAHRKLTTERKPPLLFTVNPEKTKHHISLLSFARVPIVFAIEEATKSMSAEQDRFLRILNAPHFLPELNTLAAETEN